MSFSLPIHSRVPASNASSTTNQDNISFASQLDKSPEARLSRTIEHYRDVITERDEVINRLHQRLVWREEEIIDLSKQNNTMRNKLDKMRDELDKIRIPADNDTSKRRKSRRKRVVNGRHKQLAADAKREKERAEEDTDTEICNEELAVLNSATGEEEGVVASKHDEMSLSLE